ncbi:hypothetical protein EON64_19900, partial [archaeon]
MQEVGKAGLDDHSSSHSGHTQESYVVPSSPRSGGSSADQESLDSKDAMSSLSTHNANVVAGAR